MWTLLKNIPYPHDLCNEVWIEFLFDWSAKQNKKIHNHYWQEQFNNSHVWYMQTSILTYKVITLGFIVAHWLDIGSRFLETVVQILEGQNIFHLMFLSHILMIVVNLRINSWSWYSYTVAACIHYANLLSCWPILCWGQCKNTLHIMVIKHVFFLYWPS